MKTKVINNFNGRLTRYEDGDMNSGRAKFKTSWGYDPFSKPGDLTWLYKPTDIAGAVIDDAVLDYMVISPDSPEQYVYAIGTSSKLYRIDPTHSAVTNTPLYDVTSVISAIGSVSGTFTNGGSISYFNNKLSIASDTTITNVDLDGSNIASVTGASSIVTGIYHPQIEFLGSNYIGNGDNLMEIDSTNTVVTTTKLSPSLPSGMYIRDLDVTPDGSYMIITASNLRSPILNPTSINRGQQYAVASYKFYWNGIDNGVTALQAMPSFPARALSTFLNKQFTFVQDAFGAGLYEGNEKTLVLPDNVTPFPSAMSPNGTFLTWAAPEATGDVSGVDGNYDNTFTSLYYYGQLDAENPAGLWRLLRQAPSANNHTYAVPMNMLVNSAMFSRQFVIGWGKHYLSVWEYNSDAETSTYHFYRFVLPPSADTDPVLGVYETQNETFSRRQKIAQVRVYTEPTVENNGFQLDLIGSDGSSLESFTFNHGEVSDPQSGSTAVERINWNPTVQELYSFGIRVTNTGTANMTIKKIEVDYEESGV